MTQEKLKTEPITGRKEREDNEEEEEDEGLLGSMGFMFDANLPKQIQTYCLSSNFLYSKNYYNNLFPSNSSSQTPFVCDGTLSRLDGVDGEYIHTHKKEIEFMEEAAVCMVENDDPGALQSGHYIWEAAPFLTEFILNNYIVSNSVSSDSMSLRSGSLNLDFSKIIELGAGCGLVGLILSRFSSCKEYIFTDWDPGVLRLIERSLHIPENQAKCQAKCTCLSLSWGNTKEYHAIEYPKENFSKNDLVDKDQKKLVHQKKNPLHGISLIVASDVIYSVDVVDPLLDTISYLLKQQHTSDLLESTNNSINKNDTRFTLKSAFCLHCSSFLLEDAIELEFQKCCKKYGLQATILYCQPSVSTDSKEDQNNSDKNHENIQEKNEEENINKTTKKKDTKKSRLRIQKIELIP